MVEIEMDFSCGCGKAFGPQVAAEAHARQSGHVLSARMAAAGVLMAGPRGRRRIGMARERAARIAAKAAGGNGDGGAEISVLGADG